MRSTIRGLAASLESIAETVLRFRHSPSESHRGRVGKHGPPAMFRFRKISAEVEDVALSDATAQYQLLVAFTRSDPPSLGVCCLGAVEVRLQTTHATEPHPRADIVRGRQPIAADVDQGV